MRKRSKAIEDLDMGLRRRQPSERTKQFAVRRMCTKTSGDRKEPHPETYARTQPGSVRETARGFRAQDASRPGLPLRATARPMLPKVPAALHWARAPGSPAPRRLAPLGAAWRRLAPWGAAGERATRSGNATRARDSVRCVAASVRSQALSARLTRTGDCWNDTALVGTLRLAVFTEAAQRRPGVLEGEPSAMLPAVSAALAERAPGRTSGASERSMQTKPRSGQCK